MRSARSWLASAPGRALPLVLVHVALLGVWDLAARPVLTVLLLVAGSTALLVAARRSVGRPPSAAAILLVAAALRLLLLPLPPTLSGDSLRYVWDGRVLAAGFDPYRLPPEAPELAPLRDGLWEKLPHREVPTVYPPLALAVFSIAARLPAPVLALKAMLTAAELAGCALLLTLARRLRVPRERVLWYAWNPLVSLEVAGSGHVEGLGVAAAIAAVALVARRPAASWRSVAAAASAAAAVLTKLVPLVALPGWVRHSARPVPYALASAALIALAGAPVLAGGGLPPGLLVFGVSWEFNGPFWEPLWRLLDGVDARSAVESALDGLKARFGRHELWNRFYPYNYPQLLAKVLLLPPLAIGLARAWRHRHPVTSTGAAFGALLLCSATVYPWYLLWILPWAALAGQPAWLVLAATLPVSYLPQFTGIALTPWIFAAVWAPFFVALFRWPRWSID